jgi:uncharacterized protein YjdB
MSVSPLQPILGPSAVCIGQAITLTDAVTGGTWSTSAAGISTVGLNTGVVTGVAFGTNTISYILPTGCTATYTMIVNNSSPITGSGTVCVGLTTTLSSGTSGGTWTSSAPTIASVNAATGVVTGVAAGYGNATITYSLSASCKSTAIVTVNPLHPITGSATSVCAGQNLTLSDATTGGTWSTSATGVSTVGLNTGVVTGVAAGSNIVSYILPTGCTSVYTMTVNALSPITGAGGVCVGSTITLANATPGGTWTSGSPTIATVISATGVVTGVAANLTAPITYALGSGCRTSAIVSVNPNPVVASVSGLSNVSISGANITLTDATSGGIWSSSNAHASVVAGTGVVTGVTVGSSVLSYTVTNASGCSTSSTKNITVGPVPPPHSIQVAGEVYLCAGSSIVLSNEEPGGIWTSGNNNIAIADATSGKITGMNQGRAEITYAVTDRWNTTLYVTEIVVNALPDEVVITADPGLIITKGQTVTLSAIIANGGTNPIYQWQLNGTGINGATSPELTLSDLKANDEVTCIAGSSSGCGNYSLKKTVTMSERFSGIPGTVSASDIRIMPNPNNGIFSLKGTLGSGYSAGTDGKVVVEITNMLGQVVYSANIAAPNGKISEQIELGNNAPAGMYILNLRSGSQGEIFHFIVSQ